MKKLLVLIGAGIVVLLFMVGPYRYTQATTSGITRVVRISRFTGKAEMLYTEYGWLPLQYTPPVGR